MDALHSAAFDPLGLDVDLTWTAWAAINPGAGQEEHLYNPLTIHLLQEATRRGSYELFKEYTEQVDRQDRPAT